jgi:hypothetical protein
MDKRDGLILSAILIGTSIPVTFVFLLANGIIKNPIPLI